MTLRQADQAPADFAAIADDLDFIKAQIARMPTREEPARSEPLATAALILSGELLFR